MSPFKGWKPKGKMYSLRCNQCGQGFLSSYQLEAPICGICIQKAKSLTSTIEHEKVCAGCGNQGVMYGKEQCYSCYFGFENKDEENMSHQREYRESHQGSSSSSRDSANSSHPYRQAACGLSNFTTVKVESNTLESLNITCAAANRRTFPSFHVFYPSNYQ
jgi:hypothetical protein